MRGRLLVALIMIAFVGLLDAQTARRTFIKGTVTSAGRPAGSVWVIVSQSGNERGRSLTGDDGRFYIGNLAAGTYDVVVQRGNRQVYKGRATLPANSAFDIRF